MAGFFAGLTEAVIINPFELVKVQLQAERGKFIQVIEVRLLCDCM